MDYKEPKSLIEALGRLAKFYRPDAREIFITISYSLLIGILSLAIPIAANAIINTVMLGQLLQPLLVLIFTLFGVMLYLSLANLLQIFSAEMIQQRIFVRVAMDLGRKLPRVCSSIFSVSSGRELVNRFLEIATIQKSTSVIFLEGVSVIFQIVFGLVLLALYHPLLLGFGGILSILILIIVLVGWGGVRTAINESSHKYRVLAWLEEIVRLNFLFRTRSGRSYALSELDSYVSDYIIARRMHFRALFRHFVSGFIVQAIATTLLFGFGSWLVIKEQLTLGQLVAAEIIVASILTSISKLGKYLEKVYDAVAAVVKLDALMELELEDEKGIDIKPEGAVSLVVKASSPLSQYAFRLQNDLALDKGSKIGVLIDQSDHFKVNTIVESLIGVVRSEDLEVEIDGKDIRALTPLSLRSITKIVSRNGEVFAGSIMENISLTREPQVEEVLDALTKVGLVKEVTQLEKGYNTSLSETGAPLNISSVPLLMIARAIIRKPGILILDTCLDIIDGDKLKHLMGSLLIGDVLPWTTVVFTEKEEIWKMFSSRYYFREGELLKYGS